MTFLFRTASVEFGLVHYVGDVAVPLEVTRDGYPKVLGVVHYLKCVTSQGIGCLNNIDLSLLGNPEVLPALKSIQVTLEACSIRLVADYHIGNGVVNKKPDTAFQALREVIDVQQEKIWPKDRAL